MLAEFYIEALLVDKDLADQAWDKGEIDDFAALMSWKLVALTKIMD